MSLYEDSSLINIVWLYSVSCYPAFIALNFASTFKLSFLKKNRKR